MKSSSIFIGIFIVGALLLFYYQQKSEFTLPNGESIPLKTKETKSVLKESFEPNKNVNSTTATTIKSMREIFTTDNVKHSIPLDEILSGGPGKDGIPSIDAPEFTSANEAKYLNDSDIGIGLTIGGESRFYPYRILVWHEIVNDVVQGKSVLVTYCPLCATGIVFDSSINGSPQKFGVSGKLWKSNLLMYNRAKSEKDESLWSQVLGEAVLGVDTGKKLVIVRSDIVRWEDWRKSHLNTKVLSQNTGAARNYGRDPYGDYYVSDSVSFGAEFSDARLHPKALIHGIEIDGQYKAYADDALRATSGKIEDNFAGKKILISRTSLGEITIEAEGLPIPSIPGFWFSWLAVHPDTKLYAQAKTL